MDGWIISAAALILSLGGSYGLSRYQAGRRDEVIKQLSKKNEQLDKELALLKAKLSEQATAKAVEDLSVRFDKWAGRIEGDLRRMMRGMVKLAAGQKVNIEELMPNE
jgi:hypothetical protein